LRLKTRTYASNGIRIADHQSPSDVGLWFDLEHDAASLRQLITQPLRVLWGW
jgi:hypothetical protein